MLFVNLELPYFPDPNTGRPLSGGYLYIGNPNTDPTVPNNQKTVYYEQESGNQVLASQPIYLSAGGVPLYNGSPVKLSVADDYSIKVFDADGNQVYYAPSAANTFDPQIGEIVLNSAHRQDTNNPHNVTAAQVGALAATHETDYNHGDIALNTAHRLDTNNPHNVTAAQIGALAGPLDVGRIMNPLVHLPLKHAEEITGTQAAAGAKYSGAASFTRASTATYIDPLDGLLKTAAIDTPRFERMADGGIGLLVEGSSTNLALYSRDIANTYWTKEGCLVTAGAIASFVDGLSADFVYENTTTGNHRFYHSSVIPAGTGSFYIIVKPAGRTKCKVQIWNSTDNDIAFATFDLATESATTTVGSARIKALPNGWYWCEVSGTSTTSSNILFWIVDDSGQTNYTGDGTSGFYIAHVQAEQLPFGSSPIPTTTATVTRAWDVFTLQPSGNITLNTYSILCDVDKNDYVTAPQNILNFHTSTNTLITATIIGSTISRVFNSGNSIDGVAIGENTVANFAVRFDGTTLSFYIDKNLQGSIASTEASSATSISIGDGNPGAAPLFGHIRNLRIYDVALTDKEMKVA